MAAQRKRQGSDSGKIRSSGNRTALTERPSIIQSHSKPTDTRVSDLEKALVKDPAEFPNAILEPAVYTSLHTNSHLDPHSFSTIQESLSSPRPSSRPPSLFGSSRPSRPSLASSLTSATFSVDVRPDRKENEASATCPSLRPSLKARLRSSPSSFKATKPSTHPSEFQNEPEQPEQPEKHFIDSIGMVIPGVCNRSRCENPRAHFVSHWRLCEPIEYTTALADHGITYFDYSRLVSALSNVLDDTSSNPKKRQRDTPWWRIMRFEASNTVGSLEQEGQQRSSSTRRQHIFGVGPEGQNAGDGQQAEDLNRLLEHVTSHWQRRGLPVVACVGSFSLFTPNRISEAFVQILHVPLETQPAKTYEPRDAARLSFIDPFAVAGSEERSVASPRPVVKRRSGSPHSAMSNGSHLYHHQQLQFRDRTRPWPLWPKAIPSRKREQMIANADRYGTGPHFRAWIRAGINSRTKCTSYAKYMIEKDDNPFINTRLEYVNPPAGESLMLGLIGTKDKSPSSVNMKYYEHNRRLECRRTIENGSRLRIVRFGFWNPLHPPHTAEMDALGLTREKYATIVREIEDIRQSTRPLYFSTCLNPRNKVRGRYTVDLLNKVIEYIRQINGEGRRVVWTIEKIPGVYDQGIGCGKQEWEISAWNGEDPLKLLIQLEKWGIIEKRLDLEDDD
ncbi:hypothetical protein PMIN04_006026 [Paraphaeosphaeria minitans]